MDIDNLKIILKVAEFSSINKASLSVYKTQSQVSRIVRDFESLVNTTIFDRSTKGVKTTEEGEKILAYCAKITSLYDEMLTITAKPEDDPNFNGSINVYSAINIYSTMSEIIAAFTNIYPNISINYSTMQNEEIIRSVLESENTLGAFPQIYTENKIPHYHIPDNLSFTEYLQTPVIAQCHEDTKYAKKYKSLSPKTLKTLPLIDFNPYRSGASFTSTLLKLMGIESPVFKYSTDDLRVLHSLLKKGAGVYVGICPSARLMQNDIAFIPIRNKIKVSFGALIRKEPCNDLITLFQNHLSDWYSKIY